MEDLQTVYRQRGIRSDDTKGKINLIHELMPGSDRIKASFPLKDIGFSSGGLADRFMSLGEYMPDDQEHLAHLEHLYEGIRRQRQSGKKVVSIPFPYKRLK